VGVSRVEWERRQHAVDAEESAHTQAEGDRSYGPALG
jgi:hypothetical protein